MTTALAEKPTTATPAVTVEELDLIKRTVANGATDAELKLFLFDCARQGVHPLDRLIHFTKRSGKYTPVTSIDFMRIRAAESGEYAGNDDAEFVQLEDGNAARVTVWRLVQGQRCAFTATARWSEYKPEQNDFMWRKMPHTMLAKCAEALALRKGFPRQLAGLYAKEEMDQAGPTNGSYVVEAPVAAAPLAPASSDLVPSVPNGGDSGHSDGWLRVMRVEKRDTRNANVKRFLVVLSDGREVSTIKDQLGALAEQLAQEGGPVTAETKTGKFGEDLVALHRADVAREPDAPHGEMVSSTDIAF